MSRTKCLKYRDLILNGTMTCIDPSSGSITKAGSPSNAGWALFDTAKLDASGILELDHGKAKEVRLKEIGKCMRTEFEHTDLLILENIDGRGASKVLVQACGAYITDTPYDILIELNCQSWQAIARRLGGWEKSDEADAIYMGWAAIAFAMGYNQKDSEEKREEVLKEVRKLM